MYNDPEAIISQCESQLEDIERRLTWDRQKAGLEIMEHELAGIQEPLDALKSADLASALATRRTKAASRCCDLGAEAHNRLQDFENRWDELPDVPRTPMP